MKPDDQICYCFHVTKRKIVNYIRVRQPKRASQISECGGAGTGCGWCIPFLKRYFAEYRAGARSASKVQAAAEDDLTPEEYARRRAGYIRAGKGTPPPGATPLPDDEEA